MTESVGPLSVGERLGVHYDLEDREMMGLRKEKSKKSKPDFKKQQTNKKREREKQRPDDSSLDGN